MSEKDISEINIIYDINGENNINREKKYTFM